MGRGLVGACIVVGAVWSASCGGSGQKNDGGRGGGGDVAGGGGGGASGTEGTGGVAGGAGSMVGGSTDASALSVAVTLKAWQTGQTQSLFPGIAFAFDGRNAQLLSDITFRYWYTADFGSAGPTAQSYECNSTSGLVCEQMNVTIVPVSPPRPMADHYAEISFPGYPGYIGGSFNYSIMFRIGKADHSIYDQANDYSYNDSAVDWLPTTKVTAYLRGSQFHGQEP